MCALSFHLLRTSYQNARRVSTSHEPFRYLETNSLSTAASTSSNISAVVQPSAPAYSEAFISASLLTAGNVARFTVVSSDAYGNNIQNPALRSAFLLHHQNSGDAIMPVTQTSNEVHYQIMCKNFCMYSQFDMR